MKLYKFDIELAKPSTFAINTEIGTTFLLGLNVTEKGVKVESSLTYEGDCLVSCDYTLDGYDVYKIESTEPKKYDVEVNQVKRAEILINSKENSVIDVDYATVDTPTPEESHKFIIGPQVPKTMMRFNIGEWYDYYPGQIIEPCTYAEFTGNARMIPANGGLPYIVVGGCPITQDTMLMEFVIGYTMTTSKDFQSCFGFLNDNPNTQGITSNRNYRNVVNVEFDIPVNYVYKSDPTVKTYLPALQKLELSGDIIVENVPNA